MPFEQSRDYFTSWIRKKAFYYYFRRPYEHQKKYYFDHIAVWEGEN
jgi:hypothetical protein